MVLADVNTFSKTWQKYAPSQENSLPRSDTDGELTQAFAFLAVLSFDSLARSWFLLMSTQSPKRGRNALPVKKGQLKFLGHNWNYL